MCENDVLPNKHTSQKNLRSSIKRTNAEKIKIRHRLRCKYWKVQVLTRYFAGGLPTTLSTVETQIKRQGRRSSSRVGLAKTKYVVLSDDGFTKPRSKRWMETLQRWLVQCPNCTEVRLVVGARENDRYVCKDCGHSFIIRFSIAASEKTI